MVGFNSGYITDGCFYFSSGGQRTLIGDIQEVTFSDSDDAPYADFPIRLDISKDATLTGKLLYYNKDFFAQMMGYKNHNCYCRAIRRMKRKKKELKKLQRKLKYAENA